MTDLYLGTAGWMKEAWRGPFYPPALPRAEMLQLYSSAFNAAEAEIGPHSFPSATMLERWREAVGPGFEFLIRVPDRVTHLRRLRDSEFLDRFVSSLDGLGDTKGPLVLRVPDAVDDPAPGVVQLVEGFSGRARFAIDIRELETLQSVAQRLNRVGAVPVLRDRHLSRSIPDPWPWREAVIRLCDAGSRARRDGSRVEVDRLPDLERWAELIGRLAGRCSRVYVIATDRYEGHAPHTIRSLQRLLGMAPTPPEELQSAAAMR